MHFVFQQLRRLSFQKIFKLQIQPNGSVPVIGPSWQDTMLIFHDIPWKTYHTLIYQVGIPKNCVINMRHVLVQICSSLKYKLWLNGPPFPKQVPLWSQFSVSSLCQPYQLITTPWNGSSLSYCKCTSLKNICVRNLKQLENAQNSFTASY